MAVVICSVLFLVIFIPSYVVGVANAVSSTTSYRYYGTYYSSYRRYCYYYQTHTSRYRKGVK